MAAGHAHLSDERRAQLHARFDDQRSRMLKLKFYAITWCAQPHQTADDNIETLPEHLDYLLDLEKKGILFASGPMHEQDGTRTKFGLSVVRAASFDEAVAIAENEPFVKRGLRTYSILVWELNEGHISFEVLLGVGEVRFT
jgi:uncharacterized protein YciI